MDVDQIYCGDCLEVMGGIESGSIDMVLCDLPYGTTQNKWDSLIDLDKLWSIYWQILVPNGVILLTAQQPFTTSLIVSQRTYFRYDLVWDKVRISGFLNAKRQPLRSHESVLVFYRSLGTYNPQFSAGEPTHKRGALIDTKSSTNYGVYQHVPTADNGTKKYPKSVMSYIKPHPAIHPTQKPVPLFEYLIRTYSNEGDLILDNCIGSGTTGVAAIRAKRHFIGIDNSEDYCTIARERVKWEQASSLTLF